MMFIVGLPPTFVLEFVAEGSTVGIICRGLLLIAGFVGFVLGPAVWFYNRPSFLVAPHRALPGLLAERRGEPVPPVPPPAKPPRWHARPTA